MVAECISDYKLDSCKTCGSSPRFFTINRDGFSVCSNCGSVCHDARITSDFDFNLNFNKNNELNQKFINAKYIPTIPCYPTKTIHPMYQDKIKDGENWKKYRHLSYIHDAMCSNTFKNMTLKTAYHEIKRLVYALKITEDSKDIDVINQIFEFFKFLYDRIPTRSHIRGVDKLVPFTIYLWGKKRLGISLEDVIKFSTLRRDRFLSYFSIFRAFFSEAFFSSDDSHFREMYNNHSLQMKRYLIEMGNELHISHELIQVAYDLSIKLRINSKARILAACALYIAMRNNGIKIAVSKFSIQVRIASSTLIARIRDIYKIPANLRWCLASEKIWSEDQNPE